MTIFKKQQKYLLKKTPIFSFLFLFISICSESIHGQSSERAEVDLAIRHLLVAQVDHQDSIQNPESWVTRVLLSSSECVRAVSSPYFVSAVRQVREVGYFESDQLKRIVRENCSLDRFRVFADNRFVQAIQILNSARIFGDEAISVVVQRQALEVILDPVFLEAAAKLRTAPMHELEPLSAGAIFKWLRPETLRGVTHPYFFQSIENIKRIFGGIAGFSASLWTEQNTELLGSEQFPNAYENLVQIGYAPRGTVIDQRLLVLALRSIGTTESLQVLASDFFLRRYRELFSRVEGPEQILEKLQFLVAGGTDRIPCLSMDLVAPALHNLTRLGYHFSGIRNVLINPERVRFWANPNTYETAHALLSRGHPVRSVVEDVLHDERSRIFYQNFLLTPGI